MFFFLDKLNAILNKNLLNKDQSIISFGFPFFETVRQTQKFQIHHVSCKKFLHFVQKKKPQPGVVAAGIEMVAAHYHGIGALELLLLF